MGDRQEASHQETTVLRQARELASRLVDDGPLAIFQIDVNGQIIEANNQAADLVGLKAEDLVGQIFDDAEWGIADLDGGPLPPEKLPFRQVLATGKAVRDVRHTIRRSDGKLRVVSSYGSPLHDEEGRISGVVFALQDLAQPQRFQTGMQRDNALRDAAFRVAKVGGWELGANNEVIWTKEIYRIHELSPDSEPPIDEAINFYHPEDRPILVQSIHKAFDEGCGYDLQLRFTTAKGNDLIVRTICTPVLEDGKVVRLQGALQDITEQVDNQAFFQMLFQNMSSCVAVYKPLADNSDFEFVGMNPAALKYSKISLPDVIGNKVTEVFPGVKESGVFGALQRVSETGLSESMPTRRYKDDRIEMWVDNHIFKLPTGLVVAIYYDVTSQHQAREELRQSERRYRRLSQNSPAAVFQFRMDTDGSFSFPFITDSVEKMLGVSAQVVMRDEASLLDKIHVSQRDAFAESVSESAREMTEYRQELMVVNGRNVIWVEARAVPEKQSDGSIMWNGYFQDITKRKRSEQGLRRSLEILRKAEEIANEGSFEWDLQNDQFSFSEQWLLIHGVDAPMLKRNELMLLAHPDDRGRVEAAFQDVLAGNTSAYSIEHRIVRKNDGAVRVIRAQGELVRDESGEVMVLYGIAQDVTEQKEMRERILHAEKMDAVGQLAGGIAHDFNNQLTGVLGYAGMLMQDLDDPNLKHYAESIIAAGKRSKDLTMQLLAFSRKGQLLSIPLDVHKVIHETTGMLLHTIDKRIHIKQELNAGETIIGGDPSSIQSALLNICINARDAMPEGGTLSIATRVVEVAETLAKSPRLDVADGRYIAVSVTDTGSGIAAEDIPHVFEPFYTTKPKGKGTGMGLAAAFGTAKRHGGDIALHSKIGEGTCFEIFLPLTSEGIDGISSSTGPAKDSGVDSLRVLVVDDEDLVRELECKLLSRLGHSVLSAANGKEAVALYRDEWRDIDLVVLDLIMPEMGGKEAFREMKAINPELKVILVSGYSIDHEAQSILNEGAVGFVQKPFAADQLMACIRSAFD